MEFYALRVSNHFCLVTGLRKLGIVDAKASFFAMKLQSRGRLQKEEVNGENMKWDCDGG